MVLQVRGKPEHIRSHIYMNTVSLLRVNLLFPASPFWFFNLLLSHLTSSDFGEGFIRSPRGVTEIIFIGSGLLSFLFKNPISFAHHNMVVEFLGSELGSLPPKIYTLIVLSNY